MLERIANAKQEALPKDEKIEVQINILNQLTAKNRYSFESLFRSRSETETFGNFESQIQK